MFKYTPKYQVKVDGKMNSTDAGIVGRRLANAALILAAGFGSAALIWAIRWW
ncbi:MULTISPECIES: hypothetical protein [Burkholderiaceae]|uniref:hypothetical protein n=1 Tax=Burkholderiaceae TaxID=119060 RepID=UPI00147EDEEC|nr:MULTISPECIES: hypothetical protein [Burkholderiaceae]MCG1038780.1 hypothetical protein [Mycetohabitans sp. B7]